MATTTIHPLAGRTFQTLCMAGYDQAEYPPKVNYIGHDDSWCESIVTNPKHVSHDTSVAAIFEANEHYDGEQEIGNVIACKRCVKYARKDNGFGGVTTVKNTVPVADRANDKQISYLRSIVAARPNWAAERGIMDDMIADMSKKEISGHITAGVNVPKETKLVSFAGSAPRQNRYAQKCQVCKVVVPANEGILTKGDNGKWVVEHTECPENPWGLATGYYAAFNVDGVLGFYFVHLSGIMIQAGPRFIPMSTEGAEVIAARLLLDPKAAMLLYGTEIGQCCRCNIPLTNEKSRELGIGPWCRSKMGW